MPITHFASAPEFRAWLEQHHLSTTELLVGFFNRISGKGGLTYAETLDEALCFGWIDGVRRKVDAHRYSIRFSPRRSGSIWSLANVRHAERLITQKKMQPSGLAAFSAHTASKTGVYSFENRPEYFPPSLAKIFRTDKTAWTFWQKQPLGYQRTAIWWVVSAKQAATRQRRLAHLISVSAGGRRLDALSPSAT